MAWKGLQSALASDPQGVADVLAVVIPQTEERRSTSPSVQEELAWICEIESGWNPAARNPQTDASGLIQFMPDTARSYGTTTAELRAMSRSEQSFYVQRYYTRATYGGKKPVGHVGDLYMLTFTPAHVDKPDDFVIFEPGSKGWEQNAGLREGPEGPDVLPGGRVVTRKVGPITCRSVRAIGTPPGPPPVELPSGGHVASGPPKGKGKGGGGPSPGPRARGGFGLIALVVLGLLMMRKGGR